MLKKSYPRQIVVPDVFYFVTTGTKDSKKLFASKVFGQIVWLEIWELAHTKKYKIAAVCIMPDHIHLLIKPTAGINISKIMNLLKGRSSRKINKARILQAAVWAPRFYGMVIDNEEAFLDKVEYIEFNPVKHGLTDNPSDYEFLFIDYGAA